MAKLGVGAKPVDPGAATPIARENGGDAAIGGHATEIPPWVHHNRHAARIHSHCGGGRIKLGDARGTVRSKRRRRVLGHGHAHAGDSCERATGVGAWRGALRWRGGGAPRARKDAQRVRARVCHEEVAPKHGKAAGRGEARRGRGAVKVGRPRARDGGNRAGGAVNYAEARIGAISDEKEARGGVQGEAQGRVEARNAHTKPRPAVCEPGPTRRTREGAHGARG